ncbi:MAG: hypothetical protein V1871_09570 [Planctomycetota bacterium]
MNLILYFLILLIVIKGKAIGDRIEILFYPEGTSSSRATLISGFRWVGKLSLRIRDDYFGCLKYLSMKNSISKHTLCLLPVFGI